MRQWGGCSEICGLGRQFPPTGWASGEICAQAGRRAPGADGPLKNTAGVFGPPAALCEHSNSRSPGADDPPASRIARRVIRRESAGVAAIPEFRRSCNGDPRMTEIRHPPLVAEVAIEPHTLHYPGRLQHTEPDFSAAANSRARLRPPVRTVSERWPGRRPARSSRPTVTEDRHVLSWIPAFGICFCRMDADR